MSETTEIHDPALKDRTDALFGWSVPCPGEFGRYRVLSFLAKGGMGAAYLAHDPNLDIRVTLKVPKPELLADPHALSMFAREAKVLARLHHPHLCRVFDVNCLGGIHYIAMAYVEGSSLGPAQVKTPRCAADLVRTLALALASVHHEGVIHRDLKPANIMINAREEPVIIDFGLALDVSRLDHLEEGDRVSGTISYMSPEQARGDNTLLGASSDVFSLGVILYELLAGVRPFQGVSINETLLLIGRPDVVAIPPSEHRKGLDPRLDSICLKALAKPIDSRYSDMKVFADDLAMFLSTDLTKPISAASKKPYFYEKWLNKNPVPQEESIVKSTSRDAIKPLFRKVARDRIRFTFVGHGEIAPPLIEEQDRLYVDVGEGLREAVIDHHQGGHSLDSAASAVLAHPEFVRASLKPWRADDEPFTIVMHREPDLDAIVSAFLAISILCDGHAPDGSEKLAAYVDRIDRGEPGMSLDRPFSLYSALMQIAHRKTLMSWESNEQRWQAQVEAGLKVLHFVIEKMRKTSCLPVEVDAFECPGLFRNFDRDEVKADIDRYKSKLVDPATHTKIATLRLRREDNTTSEVDALLVRDVQNSGDPDRCLFFKDWARTDKQHSPNGNGYIALSICCPGEIAGKTRGILSVRPHSGVILDGLAERLDEAESARRIDMFGKDDRKFDVKTDELLPDRPGYKSPNPWYDGRAHNFTIVDAPRGGSWLSPDEIESIFLQFGEATLNQRPPQ